MNRNSLSKKELVVAVILLFISVSVIPSTGTCVGNIDCNNPPTAPIFLGPTRGVVGEGCHYTINSTDPDGDDIYYVVLWEPGVIYEWFGPYPSGEEVNIGHTWDERGTYYVFSAAMDIHYDESDFTILEVIIGEIIYVDDDNIEGPWNGTIEYPYQYIQDGIDNAFEYDTVFVYNGTYYENVLVDKSINLIGEDRETTIIDGKIYVSVDWVNISEFTIQCGIFLDSCGNNIISDNIICSNSSWSGIELSYSCNNIITDNKILDNVHGIDLFHSSNNIISDNIILNSISLGIFILSSSNNNITGNKISNCFFGIMLGFSSKNIIEKNNFIGNKRHAIFSDLWRNILIENCWDSNYWDKWIGFGPKLIFGRIGLNGFIPWINFDWHPAREPYDIDLE